MNTRARLNKLEARSGIGFRLAVPRLLDADGSAFARPPGDDEVAAIRVCVGSDCIELEREDDETLRALEGRAREQVAETLNPTVILDARAVFL